MRISRDIGYLLRCGLPRPIIRPAGTAAEGSYDQDRIETSTRERRLCRRPKRKEIAMKTRVARNLGILTTAAAVALGTTGVAIASHGADDPVPHQSQGADDAVPHARHGADDGLVKKARHHHKRHH